MDERQDATSEQQKRPEPAAVDEGIVTLYAHRLEAFRRRAPIPKPNRPRVIPFGRGVSASPPPGDQEQTDAE